MSSPGVQLILDCDSIQDNSLSRLHHRSTSLSDLHEEENFDTLFSECKKRCDKSSNKDFRHAAFEMLSKALRKNVTGWHFTTFQDQLKKVLSLYDGEELPPKASNDLLAQFFSLNLRVNPEPFFKTEDDFLKFWDFLGNSIYPTQPKVWNLLAIHYCDFLCSITTFECSMNDILKFLRFYIQRTSELDKSVEFRIVFLRLYIHFHDIKNDDHFISQLQRIGGLDLSWIAELLYTLQEAEKSETCLDSFMGNLLLKLFREYSFDQIPQHHFENIFRSTVKFIQREQSKPWLNEHRELLKKLFHTSFCLHNMLDYKFQWKDKDKIDYVETLDLHLTLCDPLLDDAECISELFKEKEQLMASIRLELIKALIVEMNRLHKFETKNSSPREVKMSTSPRGTPMARVMAMSQVSTNLTSIKKYLENLGIYLVNELPKDGDYLAVLIKFASQYECLKPLLEKLNGKDGKP